VVPTHPIRTNAVIAEKNDIFDHTWSFSLIILSLISKRASYNIVDLKFYKVSKNSAKFWGNHYSQVPSISADIKYGLNYI